MADPEDMIVPLLRQIREEASEFREETQAGFKGVNDRLDKIDERQKRFNNALTADTMKSKFMLGDYKERLAKLGAQMTELLNKH